MPYDLVAFMSSAARNGLTSVIVAAGEDVYQGAGTVNLRGRFANGRIIGGECISAAIANITGWRLHRTTDPNWCDPGALFSRDQTAAVDARCWMPSNYKVAKDDLVNAQCGNTNNAQYEAILALIADGPGRRACMGPGDAVISKLPEDSYWLRGAGTATAVAGQWTAAPITWTEVFTQSKRYRVHGLAIYGANCYAGRLTIGSGPHQTYRPGCPGGDTATPPADGAIYFSDPPIFEGLNPPNIQYLASAADTAEVVHALVSEV